MKAILLILIAYKFCTAAVIQQYLPNGMCVLIKEVFRADYAVIRVHVAAGSVYEGEFSASGVAHLVEHMIFKGTKRLGPGELAEKIERLGGEVDGWTSRDVAMYEVRLPASKLPQAVKLLADALFNSTFPEVELQKEKQVILQEMRIHFDSPQKYITNRLFEEAFHEHPYSYPIIGYENLFNKLTRQDVIAFYRKHYTPDKMVIAVVGAVDAAATLKCVERAFSRYPRGIHVSLNLPNQTQIFPRQQIITKENIKHAYLYLGYRIPNITHSDVFALDTLAVLLGEGKSSRLYKKIKEKLRLVHSISAYSYTPKFGGLFSISAQLPPKLYQQAKEAILSEIEQIKAGKLTADEVAQAKTRIIADTLYENESLSTQAFWLCIGQMYFKNPDFLQYYIENIKQLDREEIIAAAREYLNINNLTIVAALPKSTQPKEITKTKIKQREIERLVLDNGLVILLGKDESVDFVVLRATILGGLYSEKLQNNGISKFTADCLIYSTKRYKDTVKYIERFGGVLTSYSSNNTLGICIQVPKENSNEAILVLADLLTAATFQKKHIELIRADILAAQKSQEEDPFEVAYKELKNKLWKNHQLSFSILGTVDSINNIDRAAIVDFYKTYFTTKNTVVALFGNWSTFTANFLCTELGKLPAGKAPTLAQIEKQSKKPTLVGITTITTTAAFKNSILLVGFLGPSIKDRARYPIAILDSVLSEQGGRLFRSLREQLGLVYAIGSFAVFGLDSGGYIFYLATAKEKLQTAKDALFKELGNLVKEGITQTELERAKALLRNQHTQQLISNSTCSLMLSLHELYGLGYETFMRYPDEIGAITLDAVNETLRQYIDLDKYVMVTLEGVD